MRYVVGISGGKDSVAMALRLLEAEPRDYEYLITPTGNEPPEMFDHWRRLEELLGKKFIELRPMGDGDGLIKLIRDQNALPNWRQRWCTRILKIEPTIEWLKANSPCTQYVGLRADEPPSERGGIYGNIEGVEQNYPLRRWGWGVDDVWRYLAERGIKIPARTDCVLCYGQRVIEWKRLNEQHPQLYQIGVDLEQETGHTFRSPQRDTWPAGLAALRDEFANGRKVKGERSPGDVQYELFEGSGHESCRVCRM